jgi:hypothetical protein
MKLKIYVLDLEVPAHTKRRAIFVGIPLAVILGGAALVYAGVPNTFTTGDVLSAQLMNANFSALDSRLTTLETKTPVTVVSESNITESGPSSADFVFQSAQLSLTPGTWLIEASAVLTTTPNEDVVQLGLWNETTSTEVIPSRSPLGVTGLPGVLCDGATTFCDDVPLTTTSVVTVAIDTTIKLMAYRNGVSTVHVGVLKPSFNIVLPQTTRLTAVKL